jgi:hypothetical protein
VYQPRQKKIGIGLKIDAAKGDEVAGAERVIDDNKEIESEGDPE